MFRFIDHSWKNLFLIFNVFVIISCSQSGNKQISSSVGGEMSRNFVYEKQKISSNEAPVEQIKIMKFESFPIQLNVVTIGNLPDKCTTIDQITEEQTGTTLSLKITTTRQTKHACTKATNPYEEIIPLNIAGLSAGIYTVKVNNLTDTFELKRDNLIP
jgi:inhibitor of cysteine peptidase